MTQELPPLSPRLQALEEIDARTRRNRRWGVTALVVGCLGLAAVVLFMFRAWWYQERLGDALRRDLAFRHETPLIMSGSERREVFALYPEWDGAMARAGVEEGDIVVRMSVTEFYRLAESSRGLAFVFTVVAGGNGIPLRNRERRMVVLSVPE